MTIKLDTSRNFGTVYGSSDGTAYMQDGHCFRGDGVLVGSAAEQGVPVGTAADHGVPVGTTAEPAASDDSRERLESLHPSKIKKLVTMAGLEVETGMGSKGRNIENLLAAG